MHDMQKIYILLPTGDAIFYNACFTRAEPCWKSQILQWRMTIWRGEAVFGGICDISKCHPEFT